MDTHLRWIITCLMALSLDGCIAIPIPTGAEEPYAKVASDLSIDITTKDDVQPRFGKPAAVYSNGSKLIFTEYRNYWDVPFISSQPSGMGISTIGKQHFLILDFDDQNILTDIQLDDADDSPGSCSRTGICHDGAGHIIRLASKTQEAIAKEFSVSSDRCGAYLYAHKDHSTRQTTVTLDGVYMGFVGQWGIRPFFFWQLKPGKHEITYHPGSGTLSFTCRKGELLFVQLKMKDGVPWSLEVVDNSEGRKQIRSSGLWHPKRNLIVHESGHSEH
jgi:hypothetical protein